MNETKPAGDTAITFVNKAGHRIRLNEKMPLKELMKMGLTRIRIVPHGTPLNKGEYRNVE